MLIGKLFNSPEDEDYGIYHHISAKHLQRYVGEYCTRHNVRNMTGEGARHMAIKSHPDTANLVGQK